jgi:hypothetical protein
LTNTQAKYFMEKLTALRGFPFEGGGRGTVAEEIRRMCRSATDALWLVGRVIQLCSSWPGPLEMRRIYCSQYRPLDGLEPTPTSELFPDGVPSERQLEEWKPLQLPPGAVSADQQLDGKIHELAEEKRIPKPRVLMAPEEFE